MIKIACVIPTFNGKEELKRCLDSLSSQLADHDVLIVDSSSTDGTAELGEKCANQFVVTTAKDFNHGGTRQMMVEKFNPYDVYVFLTQDAYLESENSIAQVLTFFADEQVGAVCGRQIPHHGAKAFETHARLFNYPTDIKVKSRNDIVDLGIKVPFVSNSFTAYRRAALVEAGGFPSNVILSEDMYVAAKMVLRGWKVVYAGNAECRHSHNYTIAQEFRRYFDIGVFHARESWIRENFGGAGGEGLRYVKSELKFLGLCRFYLWPSSLVRNACKLIAYKLGQLERFLPVGLKRKLSMHRRYWDGPYAKDSK